MGKGVTYTGAVSLKLKEIRISHRREAGTLVTLATGGRVEESTLVGHTPLVVRFVPEPDENGFYELRVGDFRMIIGIPDSLHGWERQGFGVDARGIPTLDAMCRDGVELYNVKIVQVSFIQPPGRPTAGG